MTLRAISIAPDGYQNSVEADRQLVDLMANRVSGVIMETWDGLTCLDLQVNPGEGHTVTVNEGQALIREKTNPRDRGGYFFSADSVEVVDLPVPQSEPFYATVIARVADPQYGAVTGDVGPRIDVVSGTPASAPVPSDDAAISALPGTPGGWIRLADIRINPADTGVIPVGQITGRRSPGGFGTISCLSTRRPVVSRPTRIYEVDTKRTLVWDGAAWRIHSDAVWATPFEPYTPIWNSSGTQPTLGNGTLIGRTKVVGPVRYFYTELTLGSSSTYGSGAWRLSLPTLPKGDSGTYWWVGEARVGTTIYPLHWRNSANLAQGYRSGDGTIVGASTGGIPWAAGAVLRLNGCFEEELPVV